ncbi:MAG: MBL fold metallo-hydrolase [Candidatus Hodarchaeales archaeon]
MSKRNLLNVIDESLPDFYFVEGDNNGRYPFSHSILMKTSVNDAILFDTGIGHESINRLSKELNITHVFLSHWHEDHVSGNYLLIKVNADFLCHELDTGILKDVSLFQEYYDTAGTLVGNNFHEILSSLKIVNLTDIQELKNNQEVKFDEDKIIRVIHTPGHSAGHCCYYEPDSKLIFLADIDLSGLGPWYGCTDSNVDDFERSIKELLDMNIEYAVTSHKGLIIGETQIKKRLKEYLEIIYLRDDKILSKLSESKPKTVKELIGKGIIYKNYREWKDYLLIAENQMISKHISRLIKNNKVYNRGESLFLKNDN